jgi:hypothetical protein
MKLVTAGDQEMTFARVAAFDLSPLLAPRWSVAENVFGTRVTQILDLPVLIAPSSNIIGVRGAETWKPSAKQLCFAPKHRARISPS